MISADIKTDLKTARNKINQLVVGSYDFSQINLFKT